MDHAVVLNIGTRTNADIVHVTAQRATKPDRAFLANLDIADQNAGPRQICVIGDHWQLVFVW